MPGNSLTEVTHTSWLSRLGGAIKGVLAGFVLLVVAFPLLFWNEGRAVKQYKTLKEGGGSVVSVASDAVDPAHDGKLIHLTGTATAMATLTDSVFGVSATALKLRRAVEMYQWKETAQSKTKKTLGGGTETVKTYTYSATWSDRAIRSADFKEPAGHANPAALPYSSAEQIAAVVTLGAFTLPPFLVSQMDHYETLALAGDAPLPAPLRSKARVLDGIIYLGADPASPQVGDVRITFSAAKPTDVSVVARQSGNTLEPYHTKAGGTIGLLQAGAVTASAMFQQAQQSNKVLTWILRLVGFLLMLIGLYLIFRPLSVLADVVPLLGSLVSAGAGLIAFLLAACLWLLTIAIAWIFFRPLLGILLLAAAAGLTLAIKGRLKPAPLAARPGGA